MRCRQTCHGGRESRDRQIRYMSSTGLLADRTQGDLPHRVARLAAPAAGDSGARCRLRRGLGGRGAGRARRREITVVDVVDVRRTRGLPFSLYDGVNLPFPDARFDVAMLNFVLHHVPNERKVALLREALRVARRTGLHPGGHADDRPSIASSAAATARPTAERSPATRPFGFLSRGEWTWLFRGMGVEARASRSGGSADRCCSRSRAPRSCSTKAAGRC